MTSVYDPNNFAGRVALAASYISQGRATTRSFDTCFEMWDGDEVATVLVRRAFANPTGKLCRNIWRYLSMEVTMQSVEALKDVATRDMPAHAAATRQRHDLEAFGRRA